MPVIAVIVSIYCVVFDGVSESDRSIPAAGVHADRVNDIPCADNDDWRERSGVTDRATAAAARLLFLHQYTSQQQRRWSTQHPEYVQLVG